MSKEVAIEIAQCAFLSRLAACSNVSDCWDVMRGEFEGRGIPHVSYGGLFAPHHRSDVSKESVYMTHFNDDFIGHYGAEDHLRHDVAVQWAFRFSTPVSWRSSRLLSALNERQARVLRDGAEFGVRNGLSVPVRFGRELSPGGVFLGATGLSDGEWEGIIREQQDLLVALSLTFHEAMSRFPLFADHINPHDKVVRLTLRERECLTWAARGCQVGEVADRLGVADRTAEHHLASARSKLRARTTAQAVARALAMGLLYDGVDGFTPVDSMWESAIPTFS
ncbi:helix-turn-helix transcriptional regulator [Rhodospirillum sp. A1_3_36]|uniref:helix-turn-helix transcriptional regulator n=1 Tax=Rhodospirillum sp. A1_3_36 TaxID=3391666 RepID=UPI0039A646A3